MTVTNNDILKLVVEGVLPDGSIAQNVFYLLAELAAPQADQTVLNALETWVEAAYTELIGTIVDDVTFNDITCDIIEWVVDGWETSYHVGTEDVDLTPTSTDDWLPNQVSAFATFNTERPKSKGRKFTFGFSELSMSGSYLSAGTVTAMVDFAAEILTTITLAPFNTLTPGIVRTAVELFLPFTSAVVTNVCGTQRRRRPGVGI